MAQLFSIIIACVWVAILVAIVTVCAEDDSKHLNREKGQTTSPCCLPFRFQAIIAPLATFSLQNKVLTHLYRDWQARIQIQEQVYFNNGGVQSAGFKIIMDFINMKEYIIKNGVCQTTTLTYGMLEPCMPDNALYVGTSFIGQYDNTAHFDAWYFKRSDQNRDIEMTIAVTRDKCIPVMEHITGKMGQGNTDTLVVFTNLTEVVDDSVFKIPLACLGDSLM